MIDDVFVSTDLGDICILDSAQAFKGRINAGSGISYAIPRRVLERAANRDNLHGVVLKANWPITRLLMTYLTGLHAIGGQLPDRQAEAAQGAVVALLVAAIKDEAADEVADRPPLEAALRQRVLAFIEQNIHRPELSPNLIIRRFNVSRSHLYRAFASDGGVAKVLREKRLDAAIRELTCAGGSAASIAELAHRLGFSSGNQFLRAFRHRFGMTPSQARGSGPAPHAKIPALSGLQTYFADLQSRTNGVVA